MESGRLSEVLQEAVSYEEKKLKLTVASTLVDGHVRGGNVEAVGLVREKHRVSLFDAFVFLRLVSVAALTLCPMVLPPLKTFPAVLSMLW